MPRILFASFFSIIFLIAIFSDTDTTKVVETSEVDVEQIQEAEKGDEERDNVNEQEEKEKIEEIEEVVEKEELYMELISSNYDTDADKISLEIETNFGDGIEVYIGFYDIEEEFLVPIIVSSSEIKDGKLELDVHHMEDESLLSFILNGEYNVRASLSTNENEALLQTYESYNHFIEHFDLQDGIVEETDNGFKIEEIHLGSYEIRDAHTQKEYDKALFEEDKDLYEALDYAQLSKNPNSHAGEYVYYTGEIIQIMEERDFAIIRLAVTEDSYGYNFNDIVWIEYDRNTEFVDGDIVTVYGMIFGSHSYTSQAGWDITVPVMLADWIE